MILESSISRKLGTMARSALLEEVYTTPKPGLVDAYSNGAHKDMNLTSFIKSATVLEPFFSSMAFHGICHYQELPLLMKKIRKVGIDAEFAMYEATGGVNTHKGSIFTLGIFCAAAGWCYGHGKKLSVENILDVGKCIAAPDLLQEIRIICRKSLFENISNGERNLLKYGTQGIRGEALRGYPSLQYVALPVMRWGIGEGKEWNRVKLQTLITLMSASEDSNILARKDKETLRQVQHDAEMFLRDGGAYQMDAIQKLKNMDAAYTEKNISAGGCADLLAASIFFCQLTEDFYDYYRRTFYWAGAKVGYGVSGT